MEEKEYYGEIVTNKEEERIARNSHKKVLVIVMRCMFGSLGIDKFVMGKTKKGLETLISTIVFIILLVIGIAGIVSVLFLLLGIILTAVISVVLIVRFIYFLVSGLRLIHAQPKEIAYLYEDL